jgi:hypothetical protein
MAISKLTFTKIRAGAKASIRYYVHRHEEKGEQITRTIFDRDSKISKYAAYRMIDKAPWGTTFFRLVISPDKKTEDLGNHLNMRDVTEKTMRDLKRILRTKEAIEYLGIEHTNTENRHVHAMFFIRGNIDKKALRELRLAVTAATQSQGNERRQARGEAEETSAPRQYQHRAHRGVSLPKQSQRPSAQKAMRSYQTGGTATATSRVCPNCLGGALQPRGRFLECANCGMAVNRRRGISLDAPKRRGLELSLYKNL